VQYEVRTDKEMSAWRTLEDAERRVAWDRFDERFQFKPSTRPLDWPGILEPADSATFSIAHVYDNDAPAYGRRTLDLGVKLVSAFRRCVAPSKTIYVLDWQHTCYSFEPHGEFLFKSDDDWPIPPLPNGDYYIFLTREMDLGVFGHPWEQTMCVFGQRLVEAFASDPPELFTKMVRVGGRVV
jgi:hypothetical protein